MAHDDEFDRTARDAAAEKLEHEHPAQPEQPGDEGFEQGYDQHRDTPEEELEPNFARGISREDPPGTEHHGRFSEGAEQRGRPRRRSWSGASARASSGAPPATSVVRAHPRTRLRARVQRRGRGAHPCAAGERRLDEALGVGRRLGEHRRAPLELPDARRAGRGADAEDVRRRPVRTRGAAPDVLHEQLVLRDAPPVQGDERGVRGGRGGAR